MNPATPLHWFRPPPDCQFRRSRIVLPTVRGQISTRKDEQNQRRMTVSDSFRAHIRVKRRGYRELLMLRIAKPSKLSKLLILNTSTIRKPSVKLSKPSVWLMDSAERLLKLRQGLRRQWASSWEVGGLNPQACNGPYTALGSCACFFCAPRIFPRPKAPNHSETAQFAKHGMNSMNSANENNGLKTERPEGPDLSGSFSELFAFGQLKLPFARRVVECQNCGAPFSLLAERGRPLTVCGRECQRAATAARKAAWRALPVDDRPTRARLVCRQCGQTFSAPRAKAGRAAAYCTAECRRAGHRAWIIENRRKKLVQPEQEPSP